VGAAAGPRDGLGALPGHLDAGVLPVVVRGVPEVLVAAVVGGVELDLGVVAVAEVPVPDLVIWSMEVANQPWPLCQLR
jgi:hypothetical protein